MRRTHILPPPDNQEAMRWLARAAHMRPDGHLGCPGSARARDQAEFAPGATPPRQAVLSSAVWNRWRGSTGCAGLSPEAAARQFAALGYSAPQHALGHLTALTSGASRKGRIPGAALLPTLFEWLGGHTGSRCRAARCIAVCATNTTISTGSCALLRDEGCCGRTTDDLLGTSGVLARPAHEGARRHPDVRGWSDGPLLLSRSPRMSRAESPRRPPATTIPARAVSAARSLRRHELARIASADILGMLDLRAVCAALSSVWVAVLASSIGRSHQGLRAGSTVRSLRPGLL